MIWKIISTILVLLVIVVSAISTYFYVNPRTVTQDNTSTTNIYISNKTDLDLEVNRIEKVERSTVPISSIEVHGWIPDWDIPDGINTVFLHSGLFTSVSPVWFFLDEDGSLKHTPQTNGENQIRFFRENNVGLIPSIQDFTGNNLSAALESKERYRALIKEIVDNAVEFNYNGIDLDLELIHLKDRYHFFLFLEELSLEFRNLEKTLSFTVLPKWTDFLGSSHYPQTLRVQDYERIGDIVDEFRIMSYEYSSGTSSRIGPVQPLEWQEYVLKYTIDSGVPRDKIILGVATYGYDWSEREILTSINIRNFSNARTNENLENGVALYNNSIDRIKQNYDYTESFNDSWGEMVLQYTYQNKKRFVVYPTQKSMQMRKDLAAEYGIKGISYWRLGDEGGLKL